MGVVRNFTFEMMKITSHSNGCQRNAEAVC